VLDGNSVCASNTMAAGGFFTGGCEQTPGAATLADATTWTWTSASEVAFDIEDVGQMVRLTVIHDDFEADSTTLTSISEGWP
jgi:hypothetical protein